MSWPAAFMVVGVSVSQAVMIYFITRGLDKSEETKKAE